MGTSSNRDLSVPAQATLLGYDTTSLGSYVHPLPTAIRMPTDQAGQALMNVILEPIESNSRRAAIRPEQLFARNCSR